MIRIIKQLRAKDIDGPGTWEDLRMVPASGVLRTTSEDTDAGRYRKTTLSVTLKAGLTRTILGRDLILEVTFEDGTTRIVGSTDIPVRLKVDESDLLTVSAEHSEGER